MSGRIHTTISMPVSGSVTGDCALISLHGFNSAGNNTKAQFLQTSLPGLRLATPTYSYDPMRAIIELVREVHAVRESWPSARLTILGSSLGGFYTRYLTHRFGGRAILINPALDPVSTLAPALGANTNFKTGEQYVFTTAHLEAFRPLYVSDSEYRAETLVLMDMGDELLDSMATVQRLRGRPGTRLVCFPGGEHGFAHLDESLPFIIEHLNAAQLSFEEPV